MSVILTLVAFIGIGSLRSISAAESVLCTDLRQTPGKINAPECLTNADQRVRPTRTPRVRPSATPTPVTAATATPGTQPSAVGPTATQPSAALPTATSQPSGSHNTNDWHPPADGHHHGHNPLDTIYADYIRANWTHTIAHPWFSSPAENVLAPHGKHDGFKYLYEANTGCYDRTDSGLNCPKSYLFKFHSIGTGHAARVRVHSFRLLVTVCRPGGAQPCDIVEMGGHLDFGLLHDQYKQSICNLPSNVTYPQDKFQPPYASINGHRTKPALYWNSVINSYVYSSFERGPQNHVEISWFELDPWSVPALGPSCSDPAADILLPSNNQTKFQTFIIRVNLNNLPTQRPFRGFTDVFGNVDASCTAEGPTCVPLYIGANVPQGDALLFRPVNHGSTAYAPIQNFDNGTPLKMNTYEVGHNH